MPDEYILNLFYYLTLFKLFVILNILFRGYVLSHKWLRKSITEITNYKYKS